MNNYDLIEKLNIQKFLSLQEWAFLLDSFTDDDRKYAADIARDIAVKNFGNKIYIRGIIEFTNYCKNDCIYCGIRRSNSHAIRYRLDKEDIISCCDEGYRYGFRTFVLQGGEDGFFNDDKVIDIVSSIRNRFPDCAITLSIGEKSRESYQNYFNAGADRYLLRHETADESHYGMLHPPELSWKHRMQCLQDLKEIGYQTGCGCMIGSPYQSNGYLAEDMVFMGEFKPHMIGIGPFIPHKDTPFHGFQAGSSEKTLLILSLCRIMLPNVLLPATTALGTVSENGRKQGILAGANVIMPNLSPQCVRKKYMLYDNKVTTGDDAAESIQILSRHMEEIGYELTVSRGDYKGDEIDD